MNLKHIKPKLDIGVAFLIVEKHFEQLFNFFFEITFPFFQLFVFQVLEWQDQLIFFFNLELYRSSMINKWMHIYIYERLIIINFASIYLPDTSGGVMVSKLD